MGGHWKWLPLVALAGCGVATVDVSQTSEEEATSVLEHGLGAQLREQFGESARVSHLVEEKRGVLVSVALQEAPQDGDALPSVAIALYEPTTSKLSVLAKDARYREARLWGDKAALVSEDGELVVDSKVLATGVKGDLAVAADGSLAMLTLGGEDDGESAIAVIDAAGALKPIADGAGVDDRPTLSPDGATVVFVSGRTGIASFYRTTLDGAAPVQLTNVNLVTSSNDEVDAEPAGFVPPPVSADRIYWVDGDTLRYDAGEGEFWRLNVRTGVAQQEGK